MPWTKRDNNKPEKLLLLHVIEQLLKKDNQNTLDTFLTTKQGLSKQASALASSDLFAKARESFSKASEAGIEFNPCSSVIGAAGCQELIKVITRKDFPQHGLYLFDSTN